MMRLHLLAGVHMANTRSVSPDVACLAIPSLGLACALAERPALAGQPVVLADEAGTRVADRTAAASRYGVRPGMPLREAHALCPVLTVLEPRPSVLAEIAEGLVAALGTVSPLLEAAEPGVVFADLRGTEALYPRPEDLARAVLPRLPAALGPRLGVAGRRFTAYVAAQRAAPGALRHVPDDDAAMFLAAQSVSVLPLDRETLERLRLLDIATCGAFAALPRHAVEAQFGLAGGRAWLAARGEDPTPVRPQPWARERVVERVQAEPPLVSRESILHALEQLLGRALRHPRATHRFVRVLRLHAESERGAQWSRAQVLREPLGDRTRLWTVLQSLIGHAEFPGPLSLVSLELGDLTQESGRQRSLFDADRVRRSEQLDEMVRHLKVRFGQSPVARVVAVEPWHRLPERRHALLEYDP